jgi:uncharacterized protein
MAQDLRLRRFSDPAAFREEAEAWLLESEAEHNLLLGLVSGLGTSTGNYKPPFYFCTIERDEKVQGCAFRTPPFKLGVTRMPDQAMPLLVEDVGHVYSELPGVLGPEAVAQRFARLWSQGKGVSAEVGVRQGIYHLTRVAMPEPPAAGRLRSAVQEDLEFLIEWTLAFASDTRMMPPLDPRRSVERQVSEGQMWLWEDAKPRSMAGVSGYTPQGARIGYVYTPPAFRGRGYASACVAHLSQRVLDGSRKFCFLYTDLSNPTSNTMYRRIGYALVCEVVDYNFAWLQSSDSLTATGTHG